MSEIGKIGDCVAPTESEAFGDNCDFVTPMPVVLGIMRAGKQGNKGTKQNLPPNFARHAKNQKMFPRICRTMASKLTIAAREISAT